MRPQPKQDGSAIRPTKHARALRAAYSVRLLEAVTKLVAAGLVPALAGYKGLGYPRRHSLRHKTNGGFVTGSNNPLVVSGLQVRQGW